MKKGPRERSTYAEAESSLDRYSIRTSTPTPTGHGNYPSVEIPSALRSVNLATIHNSGTGSLNLHLLKSCTSHFQESDQMTL